jgi:hypothetical protein
MRPPQMLWCTLQAIATNASTSPSVVRAHSAADAFSQGTDTSAIHSSSRLPIGADVPRSRSKENGHILHIQELAGVVV